MAEKNTPDHTWFMERRYLPLITVVAFVLISAIAFTICYRHHTIHIEHALKEDRSDANLLSLLLDEHLKKTVSIMESYGNRKALLQAVGEKNVAKAKVHLVSLTKSNPGIDSVIITDRRGTLWVSYPDRPENIGKNLAYRDWYKDVSKGWKSTISDVFLRIVAEKDLAIPISVPLFDEQGKAMGILLNAQRTVGLHDLIKQIALDPGADITVTDRKGQIVYSSLRDSEKEIRLYPFHPDSKNTKAAKNKSFAVHAPEFGGKTRYISFAPAVNIGWTVFVGRDKRSIFLSEISYYIQVAAIALLLFMTIVLFLAYSRRQLMAQELLENLRAEEKVHLHEERYQTLFDRATDGIMIMSSSGEVVDVNESFASMHGYSKQELLHMNIKVLNTPETSQLAPERMRRLLAGKQLTFEVEHFHKDGHVVPLEVSASLISSGGESLLQSYHRDITERKLAECALSESERHYSLLFNAIDEGFCIIEVIFDENEQPIDYRFLDINPSFEKQTGLIDAKGKRIRELAPQLEEYWFEIYGKIAITGQPLRFVNRAEQLHRWYDVYAFRLGEPEDRQVAVLFNDITERRRVEEKLNDTLDSLRKAVGTTIQVMVSAVELRDPYTSGHQIRAADLARAIAMEMGLPQDQIDGIRMAGSIHDIGKLSIPAEILSKPTKLSELEFALIKNHSQQGYEMLAHVESPWPLAEIVHQHHERMDGSGYPRNLKGEEICIEARILTVADVVEAMASDRPYRPGLGIDAALNEIEKNSGIFYDNAVAAACLRLFREKRFKLAGT